MKVRRLLVATALVSSILGAVAAYLAMTVPNDLKAGAMLRQARAHLATGRNEQARDALSDVIQRFPRTDAAAAAIVALVKLDEQERQKLHGEIARLRTESERQSKVMGELQKNVESVRTAAAKAATPPPAPAKVSPAKKTRAKKTPTKRKTTTKKRRKR